ncbi:RNA methyltransferase [Shewanella gelidii]|uniref:RNA methyltransferase TrmH n=1 Tax=Shewanella gelidii TaxID=1642821 RepID=A0A917JTG6_9GAMM|nr:RNA methyltransferase [Shewanella gelidii]MCL1098669.1 RNA methyltransferase [Shewanella gelidii]GGI86196.1 RNA methyltransferase TrmH [Shewanella gelidii]
MSYATAQSSKVYLGLTNPKTPTNVGSIMRAAGCFNVDGVFYTGERYARAAQYNPDTKDIAEQIPLVSVKSLDEQIDETTQIVCVDLVEGATPLPLFEHPENAIYIFGPEDGTISQEMVDKSHAVVYVPTIGCLNLAATVNVLLYDRLAKSQHASGSDDLIRKSRDTNNRVTVKR